MLVEVVAAMAREVEFEMLEAVVTVLLMTTLETVAAAETRLLRGHLR